jgi:hypothetical protein
MDSNENINDMTEAVGAMALKYGADNGLSDNEIINAMVNTTILMAFTLKKDDADLAKLKANLVNAMDEVFDHMAEPRNAKA